MYNNKPCLLSCMNKKALEEDRLVAMDPIIVYTDHTSDEESDDIRLETRNSPRRIPLDGRPYSPPSYVSDYEDSFKSTESALNEDRTEREDVPSFNKNALPSYAKTYQLEKFERKAMIIFNHEKVEGYEDREGTLKDEESLRDTFSRFGFVVHETGRNLKKVDILRALREFSEQDFTDFGCVVIVILTHGSSNGLLLATDEGQRYSERDIISYFKTKSKVTLITKPIILIIQACRGEASAQGVEVRNIALRSGLITPKDAREEFEAYYLPVESDMLVFHSSYPGKPSFRPDQGSWFIQTLCKLVNQLYLTHDLESIFTEVKREVAIDKYTTEHNPVTGENDVHKQMPVVTSTLIRKLYLRRYNDIPPVLPTAAILQQCAETLTDSELQNERPNCDCYMDHFNYMKACLRNIVKNYPQDETANCLLSIAENESGINEGDVKNKLTVINNHIRNYYRDTEFHKFIHFFKSDCYFSHTEIGPNNSAFQILNRWNASICVMAGVCAYLVYRCRRPIVGLAK